MSDIAEKLRFLMEYFYKTRGVGHTKAMLEGANSYPCIVVVRNEHEKSRVLSEFVNPRDVVTVHGLERLMGRRDPLLFDNSALIELFSAAAASLDAGWAEIEHLRKRLEMSGMAIGHLSAPGRPVDASGVYPAVSQIRLMRLPSPRLSWKPKKSVKRAIRSSKRPQQPKGRAITRKGGKRAKQR